MYPAEIISGGPTPDGIPPVEEPRFHPAGDVDFLKDTEPVLALRVGDDARAYPVQIMIWHEIVNDTVGGVPVTVRYCPLCNSAVAYDRRVGERVLDFGTSGRLYRSALVWPCSPWPPCRGPTGGRPIPTGMSSAGRPVTPGITAPIRTPATTTCPPLRGQTLEPVEHVDTFWFAWAAFRPDTTIVP